MTRNHALLFLIVPQSLRTIEFPVWPRVTGVERTVTVSTRLAPEHGSMPQWRILVSSGPSSRDVGRHPTAGTGTGTCFFEVN